MDERTQKARDIFESWNPSKSQKVEQYLKLFPEQYAKLKDSTRAKLRGINESDLFSLGRIFEQQIMTRSMNEEATFGQLGTPPTLALDFITAVFGKSVIPYIASEQVIDDVQGLVYFENIVAQGVKKRVGTATDEDGIYEIHDEYAGRGNITPGNVLARAAGAPDVYPKGYAGEMVYGEELVAADDNTGETEVTATLLYTPIRPNYVKIIATYTEGDTNIPLTAVDDGKGNILGTGVVGTVNYLTGEVSLTFIKAPTSGSAIIANYATNFEVRELPSITPKLDSKFVKANVYGLQTDTSILSSYIMKKRFDFGMQERAVQILQEQILNEITTELLFKIATAYESIGEVETVFDLTLPTGVSQQAHFNGVDYVFGVVAQKMAARSGKGTLSVALAGPDACAFLTQLNKFKRIGEATSWATVYGVYDNSTIVIRCPQYTGDYSGSIFFVYKGTTPYDACAVYAPFMPLVGVQDLPVQTALLNRRSAVASMAAVDVLVPGYLQKFSIANIPTFTAE